MAKINIFVSGISAKNFTGGMQCIFRYANGFVDMGHEVTVVPVSTSWYPEWFHPKFDIFFAKPKPVRVLRAIKAGLKRDVHVLREEVGKIFDRFAKYGTYPYQRAQHVSLVRGLVPQADISLATSYETALPNYLFGAPKKFYFAQHFEPLFSIERDLPSYAYIDALTSYSYPGVQIIANSSWLAKKLSEEYGKRVEVCLNAIDQRDFFPDGVKPDVSKKFVVMSYGGRFAEWKGFKDAAQAIALARREIPHLEWRVFGSAMLPPGNSIAPYTFLGRLSDAELRRAYSTSHVILCPSWYESFPAPPLEGMCCGAAVVTTPYGVEDYARDEKNCLIVAPKNSEQMAHAILRLYQDGALRERLGRQAVEDVKVFDMPRSIKRMSEILGIKNESKSEAA